MGPCIANQLLSLLKSVFSCIYIRWVSPWVAGQPIKTQSVKLQPSFLLSLLTSYLLAYFLHKAESFLRNYMFLNYSRNSSHFMEPEGSLLHSQAPATRPYPEPDKSSPFPQSHFLNSHLNIILPSKPGSSKWSLSLRFPHQNPVHTSLAPSCHMPRPSHYS